MNRFEIEWPMGMSPLTYVWLRFREIVSQGARNKRRYDRARRWRNVKDRLALDFTFVSRRTYQEQLARERRIQRDLYERKLRTQEGRNG